MAVAGAVGGCSIRPFQETVLVSSGRDEERLQQVSQLFALVFDHGCQTLQETPYQIRCWLKSYNPHEFFPRPFSQLQKPGTRYRYQRQWQCFLSFCFRAWQLSPALRQRISGPALDLCPVRDADAADLGPPRPGRAETTAPTTPGRAVGPSPYAQLAILDDLDPSTPPPLPLPPPVLRRNPPDAPRTALPSVAYQFTPILAGLLWVSRLLLLEYTRQPVSAAPVVLPGGSGGGSDIETDHFRSIQSRYLCRESIAATSHILRFLAYGRQLAQNEGPRTQVSWAPDYQALTLFSPLSQDLGSRADLPHRLSEDGRRSRPPLPPPNARDDV